MDGPGQYIAVSGQHKDFSTVTWDMYRRKCFSDGCCRSIRMHKIRRAIGLSQNIVEHIPNLRQDVSMRRARVMSEKHGMSSLMISLKEA